MCAEIKPWVGPPVWAKPLTFGGNRVSQLLVPSAPLELVAAQDGSLSAVNAFGVWPVFAGGQRGPEALALRVSMGARPGPLVSAGRWVGPRVGITAKDVLTSYEGALSFAHGGTDGPGLRRPQLGALHAVLGYWTTGYKQPVTVVMPTGTGKTETMLALLVAEQLGRLLVLVPTDALREQLAGKFEHLGVLQQLGIVHRRAHRPVVGRLVRGIGEEEVAADFAAQCNVIVATPQILQACAEPAREAILAACTHLFVDEAHHVEARTWSTVREAFADRNVVQFTATPFREDGRRVAGRMLYAFPLREAQRDGYFSHIDYTSVLDFTDPDTALAQKAIARLRSDLSAGHDHLLMVRAKNIPRANELAGLYQGLAPDLRPVLLTSGMAKRDRNQAFEAINDRTSKIIVCVNMLGEGFDLPALKVAAVHDPQKSLGVTLQFIGRFARTRPGGTVLGNAAIFVARTDPEIDTRLRALYAEDADWNHVLRELSEAAVEAEAEVGEFEEGFTSLPTQVALRTLKPKMSTVVYRAATTEWNPDALLAFFGEENLLTDPIGLNPHEGVAWCIVENHAPVRWGEVHTLHDTEHELFVLYFDAARRLLYINSSTNSGVFEDLAEAVLGPGTTRFVGTTVYRVMGDILRLIPTNVGVLDIRSQFRRFSMHVGPDVTEGFPTAEAQTKTQTHIAGSGFRQGERVSIAASANGRIWCPASAPTLKHWRDWCDEVGDRLLDSSISIEAITDNFLIPEEIRERPPGVLLALEWPWELYLTTTTTIRIRHGDKTYPILDVDLMPAGHADHGPITFTVTTEAWSIPFRLDLSTGRPAYRCLAAAEPVLVTPRTQVPLSQWLDRHGLTLRFEDDQTLDPQGLLLRAQTSRDPYPRDRLRVIDWTGTDITVEAQGPEKLPRSIQAKAIRELLGDRTWDIVLDDDGPGEIADIVALAITDNHLLVRLIHCKYASGAPGARTADLYELCGQAQKSVRWRNKEAVPLLENLQRRARRKHERTGVSPWETGDLQTFYRLYDQARLVRRAFEIVLVQPGLSRAVASDKQLHLLAATELFVRQSADASLTVVCSA